MPRMCKYKMAGPNTPGEGLKCFRSAVDEGARFLSSKAEHLLTKLDNLANRGLEDSMRAKLLKKLVLNAAEGCFKASMDLRGALEQFQFPSSEVGFPESGRIGAYLNSPNKVTTEEPTAAISFPSAGPKTHRPPPPGFTRVGRFLRTAKAAKVKQDEIKKEEVKQEKRGDPLCSSDLGVSHDASIHDAALWMQVVEGKLPTSQAEQAPNSYGPVSELKVEDIASSTVFSS